MSIFKKIKEHEEAAPATKATLSRSIVSTAFILTILTVAVVAYITSAWFSSNRKTDETGVHMNIQTSPNMFIANGDTPGAGSAISYASFSAINAATADLQVDFDDPADPDQSQADAELLLVPVTHSDNISTTYGLTFLQNPSIIDRFTGVKTSDNYNLVEVTTNSNPKYYLEHKVLIASTDGTLPASALTATFSAYTADNDPNTDDPVDNAILTVGAANPTPYANHYAYDHSQLLADSKNMYQYAASVDFYVNVITQDQYSSCTTADSIPIGTYVDTLNIAQKDISTYRIDTNGTGTAKTSVTLLNTSSVVAEDRTDPEHPVDIHFSEIPCNSAASGELCAIVVTMRFYFDGALLWHKTGTNDATEDTAYVHSAYLDIASMPNLYVKFEATAP